jgi:hypothetical protein
MINIPLTLLITYFLFKKDLVRHKLNKQMDKFDEYLNSDLE